MDHSSPVKPSKNFPTTMGYKQSTLPTIRAEEAVQTIINSFIKKANNDGKDIILLYFDLLELQNTPINEQLGSPAQRLMGRRTRTTSIQLLVPKPEIVQNQLQQQSRHYDQNTKQLPKLNKGDNVNYKAKMVNGGQRPLPGWRVHPDCTQSPHHKVVTGDT